MTNNLSLDKNLIHIIHNDKDGVIYCSQTNTFCAIDKNIAIELEKIQDSIINETASIEAKESFNNLINRTFACQKFVDILPAKKFNEAYHIKNLEIIVQTGCNLRCKYCYAKDGTYGFKKQVMSLDNLNKYIDGLVPYIKNIEIVSFFGGEPAQYPEVIEYTCKKFEKLYSDGLIKNLPTYSMITNGTFHSEKLVGLIKKNNIHIAISLDGPKDIDDLLRIYPNQKGTYDDVIKTIDILKSEGIVPYLIEATYTKIHADMMYTQEDIYRFIRENIESIEVMVRDCIADLDGNNVLGLPKEEIRVNLKNLVSDFFYKMANNSFEGSYNAAIIPILKQLILTDDLEESRCNAGMNEITLMPNGTLYPCHSFSINNDFCIGTFEADCWNFENYDNVFHNLLNKGGRLSKCTNCWANKLCTLCPCISCGVKEGFEIECSENRKLYDHILLEFASIKKDAKKWNNFINNFNKILDKRL